MPPNQPLVDTKVLRPAQIALALKLITRLDFLRLKTIARLHARGLPPDVDWDDLLQEAFTRVIAGSRQLPDNVTMIAFLAGIMRSLKSDHWRRVQAGGAAAHSLRIDEHSDRSQALDAADPQADLERAVMARQELTAIESLFADDPWALKIIKGLGEGLSADQIRRAAGISKTEYDSTRRRMRRTLIREGLTCDPK
jgi:RNA polymerase sigma-70 factor (ECF subfamily)